MRAVLRNEGTWAHYRGLVMGIDSLDEPVASPRGEEDEMTRGDLIPDTVSVEEDVVGNLWVEEMLGTLPVPLQVVMRLTLEGYNSPEIGQMLGLKDGTIRARMTHARRALRANYESEDRQSGSVIFPVDQDA